MAKTRVVKNFRMVGSLLGDGSVPTISLKESASQTFKRGDPVMFDDGYVSVHGGSTRATILGFAAEDAHNSASDGLSEILVWPATPFGIYEGSFTNGASTNHVLVQTNIGDIFGIILWTPTTPDTWVVDLSETTTVLCRIIGPGSGDDGDPSSEIGDTNARVKFTIPASACELFTTTATA